MPLLLGYLWLACALATGVRLWCLGPPSAPWKGTPVRFLGAGLPLFLAVWLVMSPGHRFWFHLPRALLHPALAWSCIALWGLLLLRNVALLARMAMADHRLRTQAWPLTTLELAPWLDYPALVRRAGLRRGPRLLGSKDIGFPVALGLFPPVIILPQGWVEAGAGPAPDPERLRQAILHELMHVAQGDLLRRGLDYSTCLLLPLEAMHLPLRVDHRFAGGLRRFLGAAQARELAREEALADARAGAAQPPAPPRARTALATAALLALVWAAPGQLNVQYALAGDVAIPGLLPEEWSLLTEGHWQGSYGFIPAGSKRDACILMDIRMGQCALGQMAALPPGSLNNAVRLEFEVELEADSPALPGPSYAGLLLRLGGNGEDLQAQSWAPPGETSTDLETLGQGRFRFRNGVDLEGLPVETARAIGLRVFMGGPGRYRVFAPHLWLIGRNGQRTAFA